jgi:hypothetical protein
MGWCWGSAPLATAGTRGPTDRTRRDPRMRNPEGTCSREPGAEEVSEARDEKGRGDVEGSTVREKAGRAG